jgi:hypothetical protein
MKILDAKAPAAVASREADRESMTGVVNCLGEGGWLIPKAHTIDE